MKNMWSYFPNFLPKLDLKGRYKVDRNFVYLGVVILIILLVMVFHSLNVPYINYSFGFCNYKISCKGIKLGEVCLGAKVKAIKCLNPEKLNDSYSSTYRRIELECALEANHLCKVGSIKGFEWVPLSSYKNKTCKEWKETYPEIKLLSCNQTFADVSQYPLLR